ncbi:hypothetical protein ATO8_09658 [Roseivivax marinus]|uniref:Uncharacterized protein n=1 Tax=Roseivivax marinus TaxID=1379903 RepID=W4HJB0_9RHOB|nr:DUF6639 family protein [Roseivivax marinus]ETW12799.1 hypothetical protein ATO8_09658 [Roseivivax marinus]
MIRRGLLAAAPVFLFSGGAALPDTVPCETPGLSVEGATPELSDRICRAADAAAIQLADCALPLSGTVTISTAAALENACYGLYHVDGRCIEVLDPDSMAAHQATSPLFAPVSAEAFFDSIILHELVHAAFADRPCPMESCVVTAEYLAFGLQIMFLPEGERARLDTSALPARKIGFDEINAPYLFMAPHRFALKAWRHLTQHDDVCAFVDLVARGNVVFDRPHP